MFFCKNENRFKEIEKDFREYYFAHDKRKIFTIILVSFFTILALEILEFFANGISEKNLSIHLVRSVELFIWFILIVFIKREIKLCEFDFLVFVWVFSVIIGLLTVELLRSEFYFSAIIWSMVIVLGFHLVLPISWRIQVIINFLLTAGILCIVFIFKAGSLDTYIGNSTIISCIVANVIAGLSSKRTQFTLRKDYLLLSEEKKLRKDLELSIKKIKTLEGLLPVCSSCKRIRDDKGSWSQIEVYVETHTDAQFTHGLCEDCVKKLYGDEEWYDEFKNREKKS